VNSGDTINENMFSHQSFKTLSEIFLKNKYLHNVLRKKSEDAVGRLVIMY